MKSSLSVALVLMLISGVCDGSKILFVFNLHAYSHHILGNRLAEELALRGHEVTMISGMKNNDSIPNFKSVYLDGMKEEFQARMGNSTFKPEDFIKLPAPMMYYFVSKFGVMVNEYTFSHKNVQQHLKENHKYDLVIMEHFFTDSLKVLCHHYQAPCVSMSTVGSNPSINYLLGNPASPSFIPDFFLAYSGEMSLLQRAHNFIYQTFITLARGLYFMPQHQALIQKFFPGAPDIYEILANTSLVFLNSHFSITQAAPHVPNMVEIGGMHIKVTNEIPEDVKKFLDEASEGVVYFSFGSNLKSNELSMEIRQGLINTFKKLKQKVLWKFEDENIEGLPKNVKVSSWLPQPDILAHPNVKVFITHGGLLSLTEAMHFGVPVIGIPFYGDQPMNMAEVERNGVGIKIEYYDLNESSLSNALVKILSDKTFSENMTKRSAIMRDRPLSPMDTAVYWVEYLIRHTGGLHMQSTSVKLSWYQYYMIDVMILIMAITSILVYFASLLKLCWKPKTTDSKKQQ